MFDTALAERLKDDNFSITEGEALIYEDEDLVEDENDNINFLESSKKNTNHAVERNDYNDDAYDALLSAELILLNDSTDGYVRGTVIKRAKNNTGQPIWTRHFDSNLDSRMYIIRMADGHEKELQLNFIANNMFTQADSECRQFLLLDEIVDYMKLDSAVEKKSDLLLVIMIKDTRRKLPKDMNFMLFGKTAVPIGYH